MVGIIGIVALLSVLTLSLVFTRIATVALSLTGLSWETSRFQARSALTGTGFTTKETEKVVNHPVRRKIILLLMVLRSAGLMTIIISLIFSFANNANDTDIFYRVTGLVAGIIIIAVLSRSSIIDRILNRMIRKALQKWTKVEVKDYAGLLQLSADFTVTEFKITTEDWLNGRRIKECRIKDEGINVLGIYREDGRYVGNPDGNTKIYAGDTIVLYAREDTLKNLNKRAHGVAGERSHEAQVQMHRRHKAKQDQEEKNFEQQKENESSQ
jgi:hypothetical protein